VGVNVAVGLTDRSVFLVWCTYVQLVTHDASAPEDAVISVHTDDVEGACEEAQKLGYEIVHPITTEPWGVRRFFVRAPDGNVLNIVNHRD
jgi:catechol 2,3-dioxygenase-like lactoylglutathione lyase family enzyme